MDLEITKCKGEKCPIRQACFRYTSRAEDYQAWFMESPYKKEDNDCEHYMPNGTKKGCGIPPNCS